MSQLTTLIWLKWALFRNSLRKSKAVVNRLASVITTLAALAFSLVVAFVLGLAAYALTMPGPGLDPQLISEMTHNGGRAPVSAEFIFFSIFALCFLLWATLPLSMGSTRQFDPGNLLLYPISLKKLFALDFVSEIATLQSLFAIPAVLAIGIGAGAATGRPVAGVSLAIMAAAFGVALSKWVSTSIGALIRRKRTRGEMLLALVGAVAGLGGALFAELAPIMFRHADSVQALRWTPPGALAFALTTGLRRGHAIEYTLALFLLAAYTVLLIVVTYWLSRRAIAGEGTGKRKRQRPAVKLEPYAGWNFPFVSTQLSAIIEKELRYTMRNAQLRMMTLMPLILIAIRYMNRRRFAASQIGPGGARVSGAFFSYGAGLMATTGVLYVFLILASLYCNQFAFDQAGIRTLILSPVDRKKVLLGKNISITLLAFVLCVGLLVVNQLVFRDLTFGAVLFAALSFIAFASLLSLMGNWFSVHFPKRVKYGKRIANGSGLVGLLLIPMIILLALVPLAATAAGYVAQSVPAEYATLAILAALSVVFYLLLLSYQGELLGQKELEIQEAVNERD